jgi:YVTN family beta-propeller protein
VKKNLLASVLFFNCLISFAQNGSIQQLKTFSIKSSGGWDYIELSPVNNSLFVSHSKQVNILDRTTGDSIGVIENTLGVHGIAFDNENSKGYTSNGKSNSTTVFDLNTYKIIGQIPTGKDPDSIS